MAELTRQELITAIDALFPTNNNELISASNARSAFRNFIESTYNKADDNINNNASVSEWNNALPYPLDFIITFNDKFWRSKANNNTNHVPAENTYWTEVSKATAGQNIDLSHYYLKQELKTAGEAEVALENVVELESELAAKANSTHNHDYNTLTNKPDLSIFSQSENLGNILFVSANAPSGNNSQTRVQALGRIDKPFRSIQSAVNVAENNDRIIIFSGTYNENITPPASTNMNFIGLGVVNVTGFSLPMVFPTTFKFENLNITNFTTTSGAGANQMTVNCYGCNITTQTLLCSGQYLFENCKMGNNGSVSQGQFGFSIFKHKNCVFTNDLFYFYNGAYGIPTSNKLLFENCEFKKVELTGDVLTPALILFDKCKFISQTTYNLLTSSIVLTNLFLVNSISNKPVHPSITNFNNFYNNSTIE